MKEFEITVKVENTLEEIQKNILKEYNVIRNLRLVDTYMVNKNIDIEKMTTLEILDNCILIRNINGKVCVNKKVKKYDENGDTISRNTYYLDARSYEEAKEFLENIDYKELMTIDDKMIVYKKGETEIAVQEVKDVGILLEIEYEDFSDIDYLKKHTINKLKELNFIFDETKLDVKKAEILLNKIRNKKEN